MVSSLALNASVSGAAVIVSRSTNGGLAWNNPVTVHAAGAGEDLDKNWTVCDNTTTSPWYGSCYTTWDDFGHGNRFRAAYSRNGGVSWTLSTTPNQGVIGGQPLTLPNGNVVVPLDSADETQLGRSVSTNGGFSFGTAFVITNITAFDDPGNIRSGPLPSAEISGDGKIYVVWEDCRFRANCYTNDLVYTTSTNGTTWTAVQRIPIDATNSTVDHFIPGVGVDRNSSGASIRVGVTYYYYPQVSCTLPRRYASVTRQRESREAGFARPLVAQAACLNAHSCLPPIRRGSRPRGSSPKEAGMHLRRAVLAVAATATAALVLSLAAGA